MEKTVNTRNKASWFGRFLVVLMFIILLGANAYTFYLVQGYANSINDVSAKVNKIQGAASSSVSEYRSAAKSIKDAEEKITAVEASIAEVNKKLAAAEKTASDQQVAITELQSQETTELEDTVADLNKQIEEIRDKITYLMMNQLGSRKGAVQ